MRGKPREERQFDQTYLSIDGHGKRVHRDYAAHYFRWGFARRFTAGKKVLDVGCGPEYPFGWVAINHGNHNSNRPTRYVGVDLSKLPPVETKIIRLKGEFDFTTRWQELVAEFGPFDLVCSFEVLEHMGEADQAKFLAGMAGCVAGDGQVFLSTPVLQGRGAARNHIRELTVDQLAAMLDAAGLKVSKRFGTYGDVSRVRAVARPEHLAVMEALEGYYANDVLSNFLAPLYPDVCSNNLWVAERKK